MPSRLYPDISELLAEKNIGDDCSFNSESTQDEPEDLKLHVSTQTMMRRRKYHHRRFKKVLGWTAVVTLFPLVMMINAIRDSPNDDTDPNDLNNDPLRPWNYKVNIEY